MRALLVNPPYQTLTSNLGVGHQVPLGLLMVGGALLAENASPTADDVRAALDRNLCRCGSHNRLVRAVLRAAVGSAG